MIDKKRHIGRLVEWPVHVLLLVTIVVVVVRFFISSPEEAFSGLSKGDTIEPMRQYISEGGSVTILIALMPTCPYCIQCMPFYRE